jgi:hypothetical protein
MIEEPDVIGPVDFVLLEFPTGNLTGDPSRAVLDLVDAGIIRLWDVVIVEKTSDGLVRAMEITELPVEIGVHLEDLVNANSGLVGEEDLLGAAEVLQPGTLAALLVYENAWATPFLNATLRSGGTIAANGRIPYELVLEAVELIDAES